MKYVNERRMRKVTLVTTFLLGMFTPTLALADSERCPTCGHIIPTPTNYEPSFVDYVMEYEESLERKRRYIIIISNGGGRYKGPTDTQPPPYYEHLLPGVGPKTPIRPGLADPESIAVDPIDEPTND